jgi:hypothetical protein
MGKFEVIDSEEESHSIRELLPNQRTLSVVVSACEQEARFRIRGANHNPSLWLPIRRQRRRILGKCKAQCIDEEVNCRVVLVDNDRHELNTHL